ncbi:DUF305 domain-containing protein [Streptosporangium sp. NPDC000239]|uniref:DUF305 domain-containing protein n=1 Tax=Streptosporangium jomthongense TaxID=1193683 RepID=A0ABV8EUW9_9ACTN
MLKRVVPLVLSAVLLAGCGSRSLQELQGGGQLTVGAAASAAPGLVAGPDFNPADVMFLQMMLPHDAQGAKLAKLAAGRNISENAKVLAAAIATTQDAEVTMMTGWLKGWKRPTAAPAGAHSGHGGHGLSDAQIRMISKSPDSEFEKRFLNALISQQDDAIQMAKVEKMAGQNAETKALADRIEASRTAQIDQMKAIVGT